jgi:CheY-like chemotaxis protein
MFDTVHQPMHDVRRQDEMKTPRWLLPFSHAVDMRAIECVVHMAESAGATLVAVSLISAPPKGARLEHIQQSQDFLEAVRHKAERFEVPLERYEAFTADVQQSLTTLVYERRCDGIVLVTGGEHSRLLRVEEVKHLLIQPPAALVLMRLSAPEGMTPALSLSARFFAWWRGLLGRQDAAGQAREKEAPTVEEPLWIRTEQHQRGMLRDKEANDMTGAHLLLVEDDDVLRELLLRNLQARGHDVRVAADAHTALAQLQAVSFDLVLLDIFLPDQTGWEVLRTAQKEGWLAPVQMHGNAGQLPVAVLSAVRISPRRLLEFRPLAYLPKPFPLDSLLRLAAVATAAP